jgi:hypothetical protein
MCFACVLAQGDQLFVAIFSVEAISVASQGFTCATMTRDSGVNPVPMAITVEPGLVASQGFTDATMSLGS